MTPMESALIRMVVALAMKAGITEYDLALKYADADECQEFYDQFLSLVEKRVLRQTEAGFPYLQVKYVRGD